MSSVTERALAAWPLLAAEMLILGTAAFTLAIAPAVPSERHDLQLAFTPVWRALSLMTLALSPLGLLVETSEMAGVSLQKAFPLVAEVLSETHVGRVWLWRFGFALVLALIAWLPSQRLINVTAILAATAALLLCGSLSSHAIDQGAAAVALYLLHELAAGLWLGTLLGLWFGFARTKLGYRWVEQAAPRVSRTAGWTVAVLVPTGVYQAYNALGLSLDHLLYSTYGRTLLLKVATFALVVSIGGYNRYRLVPAVKQASSRDSLLQSVAVESLLLMVVLGVAALLANTPPAHHH